MCPCKKHVLAHTPLHLQLLVRWPLQPLQKSQPPVSPSLDSLCHPCITTTHFSYNLLSYPIFETSAAALCGTIGLFVYAYMFEYVYIYIYIYIFSYIFIYVYTLYVLGMGLVENRVPAVVWQDLTTTIFTIFIGINFFLGKPWKTHIPGYHIFKHTHVRMKI